MKLLGKDISSYDIYGQDMQQSIINWLKDPCFDLWEIGFNYERAVLKVFQDIALKSGAKTIQQVEYFYALETRLERLENLLRL